MAHCMPPPSDYERVFDRLNNSCAQALKFLNFRTSKFDADVGLGRAYYRLTPQERLQLKKFFSDPRQSPASECQSVYKPPGSAYQRRFPPEKYLRGKSAVKERPVTGQTQEIINSGLTDDRKGRSLNHLISKCVNPLQLIEIAAVMRNHQQAHATRWDIRLINKLLYKSIDFRYYSPDVPDRLFRLITGLHSDYQPKTCTLLLKLCTLGLNLVNANALLFGGDGSSGLINTWGVKLNVYMCNAFITVCGKTGNIDRAWALVSGKGAVMTPEHDLPPDAITCVNLLTACAEAGDFDKAVLLLFSDETAPALIQRWGVKLNVFMCNAFITVCGKTGNLDKAWALVSDNNAVMTKKNGLAPDAITCLNLLTACAEAGDFDKAVLLLFGNESMPALIQRWGIRLNVFMCSAFITVCGKTGNLDKAWALVSDNNAVMTKKNGPAPDAITCLNLLTACAEAGDFDKAVLLLFGNESMPALIQRWGIRLNVFMCSAFITVCGKTGNIDRAWALVSGKGAVMTPEHGLSLNSITCVNLLTACAEAGDFNKAVLLLFGNEGVPGLIQQRGVKLDVPVCNAFITVCAKTGNIDKAWALVSGKGAVMTPELGLPPNSITCLNLLTACAEAGDFDKAVLLLFGNKRAPALIEQRGVKLDVPMCNAFITVCGKTGNIDKAWELVSGNNAVMTPELGLPSNSITCLNLLTACAEAGDFDKAVLLLFGNKRAPALIHRWGVKLNVFMCNAFITVCGKTENIDKAWALVSGQNTVMTAEHNLPPDAITCVNLLTACAEAGDFDKAVLLLFGNECAPALIQRRGVKLDVSMCNAFITVCGKTGNISAAKADLIKIMNESGVSVTAHIKALLASLESEKFQETVESGIRSNLYHHNLGITQNSLDLHIDKIFKTSSGDTDNKTGVPLEFAKLLFCYLKEIRGRHITSIITGYHGKHTLKDGMITFIRDKYNLTFTANKFNRGELLLAEPP